jgi:FdhD protein
MDERPATQSLRIQRIRDGIRDEVEDSLVVEEPLEIRVRGQAIAVTMRTPGHDHELAAGFLCTEGVIGKFSDVLAINHCQIDEAAETGNVLNVYLSPKVEVDLKKLTRHVFASSSCGLCGKATIDAIRQQFPAIAHRLKPRAELIASLPEKLAQAQEVFSNTGGLHAAALFDAEGELIVVREDVGRHNAVDKVIGHGFLANRFPYPDCLLLISGRASFEIMQKTLAAGIPVVAAVSAPSNLAVEFAKENNQTLVGFLREGRMNVYSGEVG